MADIWDGNPKTWVPGGALVASEYNTELRDRFTYLYNRLPAPNMKDFPDDGTLPTAFTADTTYGWGGVVPSDTPLYVTQGTKRWISTDGGSTWQLMQRTSAYSGVASATFNGDDSVPEAIFDESIEYITGNILIEVSGHVKKSAGAAGEQVRIIFLKNSSAQHQLWEEYSSTAIDFVPFNFAYSDTNSVGSTDTYSMDIRHVGATSYSTEYHFKVDIWHV